MTLHPQPGWVLCERVLPVDSLASGLVLPEAVKESTTAESVAIVVAVPAFIRPPRLAAEAVKDGTLAPPVEVGDRILYREFLRHVERVGAILGEDDERFFLLNIHDILAVLTGPGTLGLHSEFRFD